MTDHTDYYVYVWTNLVNGKRRCLNTKSPAGYNLTAGGEGATDLCPESRALRSKLAKGNVRGLENIRIGRETARAEGRLISKPRVPEILWDTVCMLKMLGASYSSITESTGYTRAELTKVIEKKGVADKLPSHGWWRKSKFGKSHFGAKRVVPWGSERETNMLILRSLGAYYYQLAEWFGMDTTTAMNWCKDNSYGVKL